MVRMFLLEDFLRSQLQTEQDTKLNIRGARASSGQLSLLGLTTALAELLHDSRHMKLPVTTRGKEECEY